VTGIVVKSTPLGVRIIMQFLNKKLPFKQLEQIEVLEIQDYIVSEIDKGNIVGTYSLDLSAAFDLLRPDVFYNMLQSIISPDLLSFIMDFLRGRNFCVEVGNKRSPPKPLRVGCVWGSIHSPCLFT